VIGGFLLPPPGPVLRGRAVYLRLPVRRDRNEWLELRGKNQAFLQPWEPLWRADELTDRAFLLRAKDAAREARAALGYSFLIFRQSSDRLLGGISLYNIRRDTAQSGTLGYWLGQAYARQGIMTDALTAVLSYCSDELHMHRLEAACLPENESSRRLLGRAGFVEEGFARQYLSINGVWRDHVLFGLVLSEWKKRQSP
jgi:ribosomal-protein-alanine N-acetyltransferase